MYVLRGVLVVFLIALVLPALAAKIRAVGKNCQETCKVRYRCSPSVGEPVYAVVNGVCQVFSNRCIFDSQNCSRVNKCLPKMVATTKELCTPFCSKRCTKIYLPVCAQVQYTGADNGEIINENRFFANKCVMNSWICENGATVNDVLDASDGVCPPTAL